MARFWQDELINYSNSHYLTMEDRKRAAELPGIWEAHRNDRQKAMEIAADGWELMGRFDDAADHDPDLRLLLLIYDNKQLLTDQERETAQGLQDLFKSVGSLSEVERHTAHQLLNSSLAAVTFAQRRHDLRQLAKLLPAMDKRDRGAAKDLIQSFIKHKSLTTQQDILKERLLKRSKRSQGVIYENTKAETEHSAMPAGSP